MAKRKTSDHQTSQGKTENNEKKKLKKKSQSRPKAMPMKLKAPQANPFESIWSRRKFDTLGKKSKGEERRMGRVRSIAIEKRKKTLLKEYQQSGKASVFIDKRIGEHDETLEEFDKALLRSQRQMKLSKKSKYNLSDGEEDEDSEFPILGALTGRDSFDDVVLANDNEFLADDDDDNAGADTSKKDLPLPKDRGVMEGEEKKHKSKKEVMAEIIAKSKFFKAEKAKAKEENERFVEELDQKFASIQPDAWASFTNPANANALKTLVSRSIPTNDQMKKDDFAGHGDKSKDVDQDKPDSYDKLLKEMALEMRARPSDRIKTPEEVAQEERERLEHLEEERQKRMHADDELSDEENEEADKSYALKPRPISGDDLGDSFTVDEEPSSKKGWVDKILGRNDVEDDDSSGHSDYNDDHYADERTGEDAGDGESNEGETDEEDDDDGSEEEQDRHKIALKDWEQSDDDIIEINLEADEEESKEKEHRANRVGKGKECNDVASISKTYPSHAEAKKFDGNAKRPQCFEIPYIIEAPKSLEEFSSLLNNCSGADTILIINRIRATNAIKLASENLKKMQVFYGVLLQYFAVLASKKPLKIELLNLIVKPLMEMSVEIPYFASICARQRLLHMRTQFCEIVKDPKKSAWPTSKTMILLRLWAMIFPCSDFRHAVMTPAILLMCEYLMRCPIVSGRDVAIGSFLCSMLLSVTKQSLKFSPEPIVFIQNCLMAVVGRKSTQSRQFYHLVESKEVESLLHIQNFASEIKPLNFFAIMDEPEDSSFFSSSDFRAGLLMTIIENLLGYANIYDKISSFPEIFSPILSLLLEMASQANLPDALRDKVRNAEQLIKAKVDEHQMIRRPLQMRKKKPVPIKLLNPKFETDFVRGRDYDPDHDRVVARKLKKLIKREAKGAARELRKDNHFLFEVKEKEKAALEEERVEKYGKARAFLQEQEHAFKSGQFGKGKKRRR